MRVCQSIQELLDEELSQMWGGYVKADLLNIDFINNLYQPLWIRQWGDKEFLWPVYDICVQTGLLRVDVCGKLQAMHFSDIAEFKDDSGTIYDPEEFYLEQD